MMLAGLGELQPERGVIIVVEIAIVVSKGDEIALGRVDAGVARAPQALARAHDLRPWVFFGEVGHHLRRVVGGFAVDQHELDLVRRHQRRVELRERHGKLARAVSRTDDVGDFHAPMPPFLDNSSAMGFDL